ncbi:MAG TPA: nuclear transport factor 2 family protein [Longimicrobium sp.]|nr:nuclear transport factor 2 family protein [Longimicrobium sp.]
MSTEQIIRSFVDRFYAALNQMLNGEPAPMLALWSAGAEATVMHPDGERLMGCEEVRGAIEAWAAGVCRGHIEPRGVSVRLVTGDVAVVSAVEAGRGTIAGETVEVEGRATLVIRRDAGQWKAVHHHVDVVPRVRELVRQRPAAALDPARRPAPAAV